MHVHPDVDFYIPSRRCHSLHEAVTLTVLCKSYKPVGRAVLNARTRSRIISDSGRELVGQCVVSGLRCCRYTSFVLGLLLHSADTPSS